MATGVYEGSAVKGARLFISETLPITVANEVVGVRTTGDKGAAPNMVEATTIKDIVDKEVLGTGGKTSASYTFGLSDVTKVQQLAFVNKDVWIYEETEDTSLTPTLIGNGIVMKVHLGGLQVTGAKSNGLYEFKQEGAMVSDDYYFATPTGEAGSQTFTYVGANSGKTVTLA